MTNKYTILLFCLLLAVFTERLQASSIISNIINPQDILTEDLVSYTNIPRIFYKIERDYNEQIYKVKLNVRRNKAIPLNIMPYTSETWISAVYMDELNISPMMCDFVNNCVFDPSIETTEIFYLNYSLRGTVAQLKFKGDMEMYTSPMNFTLMRSDDWSMMKNFTSNITRQKEQVSGGLGLGFGDSNKRNTFLRGFQKLDKYIASIFLSSNEFDISSELLIGDINTAHVHLDAEKVVVNVTDFDTWSFNFSSITDSNNLPILSEEMIVVLDPNQPYLGVPSIVYEDLISNLEKKYGMDCTRDLTLPTCNIKPATQFRQLYFIKDHVTLTYPTRLYIRVNETANKATLLIQNTLSLNFTSDFKSYWIFGSNFMTYYYTVLNFTDPNSLEIDFYRAKTFTKTSQFYVIIACISGFVAIGSLSAIYMLIRKDKSEKEDSLIDKRQLVDQEGDDPSRRDTIDLYGRPKIDDYRKETFGPIGDDSTSGSLKFLAIEGPSRESSGFFGSEKDDRGNSLLVL